MAILDDLAAAGVPLYAITNFSGPKWELTVARFPFLATAFRDVVVSGRERLLKPDPAIFRLCLERNGLDAAGCVFVDDSPKNVAAAAALGLDAILLHRPRGPARRPRPPRAHRPSRCRRTSRKRPSAPSAKRHTSATGTGAATSGATTGASAASTAARAGSGTGPVSVMWKRKRSST